MTAVLDDTGLNEYQKAFCKRYIFDYNGKQSYLESYPNSGEKNAESASSRLLRDPKIQAYIKHLKANLEEVTGVSKMKIIEEYKKMAFTDITDLHNTWISLKDFKALTKAQKASIASIETQTKLVRNKTGDMEPFEFVKIKLHSKDRALEALRKMFGHDDMAEVEGQLTVKIVRE